VAAYVIAVDNGSQSTKVSIFDAAGVVHASARVALRPYASPAPGRWEHPDDDLWTSITAAIREALSRFDGDVSQIRGLGLCTIRFCRAVLRADGSLAQPVMSWMDERVSRAYEAETPDARYVTTSSGYIGHRLTGRFRDTAGNYQGVWPIDAERWDWSRAEGDFARTGLRREQLFELVPPGAVLGGVTAAAAAETGLPPGLPVVATSNDKAVEALGAGLRSEREALLSLGTYVSAMMTGTRSQPSEAGTWVNFGADPGHYLFESTGIRRGMWTVSWFRDLVSGMTEEELGIVGFDGTQGRFHVHRAILEALAITMADNCARMAVSLERRIDELVVTGGGAASELMLSVLAAVFEVPVRRPAITDAAGVGAAITAAVAAGLHPDWDRATAAMVRPGTRVEPDPALAAAYREVRERYARVIPRVRALFEEG
jgi:sugar (pentulose or hexulose) kinase